MNEAARELSELSDLRYTVHTLGDREPWEAVVVGFEGDYGYGSGGNRDGRYMHAVMTLIRDLWPARDIILDLRRLDYKWGDWIENAFPNEDRLAIVVSDRCREGLTSLVKDYVGLAEGCLFETVADSLAALGIKAGTLVQRRPADRSALKLSMQAVPIGEGPSDQALLLEAEGVWTPLEAGFLKGHALAWLSAWEFSAVLFDFRALRYTEGSEMAGVLTLGKEESPERKLLVGMFGQAGDGGYPGIDRTCVLVSDLSRAGIEQLLERVLRVSRSDWMFEDLESAIRSIMKRPRKGGGFLPI